MNRSGDQDSTDPGRARLSADAMLARLARTPPPGIVQSIVIGLLAAAAGLAVRLALSTFYEGVTGFMILLPAVVLAALAGGRIAGGVAVIVCLLGGWWVAGPDTAGVGITSNLGRVATANFILVGLFVTWVASALRRAMRRLDETVADLRAAAVRVDEYEARFRDIADVAPVMLWTADVEGRVYLNAEYRRFWGDRPTDLGDPTPWLEAIHPEDRERVWNASLAALKSRTPLQIEARYLRADGDWRILETHARPRFDAQGVFLGMVGANIDLSEVRQVESALRESEGRFRDMANDAPVLIWVTAADRTREFVNEAYRRFMGADHATTLQTDWRAFIHPDDHDRVVAESIAGEATGQPFSLEARYRRADGEWRWLRSFSRPRLDAQGKVQGFVGVAFDVTDAKQAEVDLKRINELLEERVGKALMGKAQAEADLMHAQRMEAVGRLTGGVAHDFNNLLTVVIGGLDMLLNNKVDEARRLKLTEAALSAARRGERLTHQLLAFSRRQALRPETVDVNALIREGEPLIRGALGGGMTYSSKLRRGGARIRVDTAQFEAALLNLLVNARDAVGGTGKVEVETRQMKVRAGEVADLEPGDYVRISVVDDGPGIPDDLRDRIFEPFYTTKAVGKGTGLGLSQVYGFLKQSGGAIHVTSADGTGTRMEMYLPVATAEDAGQPVAAATGGEDPVERRSVLLVEDDPEVQAIAVAILETLGLKVTTAADGASALKRLKSGAFDLLLTDIVMPGGMSGLDLARRAADLYPAMRIVLATGYAGDDVDEALRDAPWALIRKPFAADALKAVLKV
ncbi:PAS domain-containing protein [Brevundimonas sp. A19_0]|uniref:PAS domain-containing protein n=1 Tax=Brevundimonas sp. A19_0 TaxID=2821087 RepID=UPI001AD991AB|nr:PAS domain-containing protein [Brevundimonas sp. A19_0]MBO9500455.1 PAS domain-containing protein [Brevundimonas sp. A19_0]